MPPRGLYPITPDEADTRRACCAACSRCSAAVAWLQYRNKAADAALRARRRRARCAAVPRAPACRCIVNDDCRARARPSAPTACTSASTTATRRGARRRSAPTRSSARRATTTSRCARRRPRAGASYVAFGAFFPSPTKPNARRADAATCCATPRTLGLPRVAIGGITADNARPLIDAGADLVAVISGVFDAPTTRAPPRARIARADSTHIPGRTPHEPRSLARPVHPRPRLHARRRQFAGARVQVGRRRTVLRAARGRRRTCGTSTASATSTTSARGAR